MTDIGIYGANGINGDVAPAMTKRGLRAKVIYGGVRNGKARTINKLLIDDQHRHLWRVVGHLWQLANTAAVMAGPAEGRVPAIPLIVARPRPDDRDHRDSPLRGGPVMTERGSRRNGV